MSEMISDQVYAVAVSTHPVLWVIHCEICDDEFGDPTDNDEVLEELEVAHKIEHDLNS